MSSITVDTVISNSNDNDNINVDDETSFEQVTISVWSAADDAEQDLEEVKKGASPGCRGETGNTTAAQNTALYCDNNFHNTCPFYTESSQLLVALSSLLILGIQYLSALYPFGLSLFLKLLSIYTYPVYLPLFLSRGKIERPKLN